MRVLLFVGIIAGGYCYFMLHTADVVMDKTMQLHRTYQYVGDHADEIASGKAAH